MIKIDITYIEQWEYIKQCHEVYFSTYVISALNKYKQEQQGELSKKVVKFLEELDLKQLAIGEISLLKVYVKKYDAIINELKKEYGYEEIFIERRKEFDKGLKEIINYNKFRDNKNYIKVNEEKVEWNRHRLISLMKVRACPYCNRQYITNYIGEGEERATADLDHFYVQEIYPFLALSLYNFIPSCQICNSRFKGSKFDAIKHIYPYQEEFGDAAVFEIASENMDYIWKENNDFKIKLKVDIKSKDYEKISNSIRTFRLNEVYQVHNDYVREIIKKAIIYDEDAINNIWEQYPDMFKTQEEIWECIMGNYMSMEKLGDRPLAKLTKDICEQYGIKVQNK